MKYTLRETDKLTEKRKARKKPYSSVTYTTGDQQKNIDHFNKMLTGKAENTHTSGYLNGTFRHDNDAAASAAKAVGTFAAASPDGGNSVSLGGDAGSGGAAGAVGESLTETVASSMPVHALQESDIIAFAQSHITTNPTNPKLFKVGYINEFTNKIPARLRGGRGSAGQPVVRIFKCTEYSAVYTGIAFTKTDKTIAADTVLGSARHTGEKTGFTFSSGITAAIGEYKDGSKALQVYLDDTSVQRVKYLISINDSDLAEIDRKDLAKYLTPTAAAELFAPAAKRAGVDQEGNDVFDRPINRLKLSKIYMIGNIGPSII